MLKIIKEKNVSTPLTIRPVNQNDFEQWQILWQGYNLFYGRPSFPMELTQLTWSRFFDNQEPMHALVALQNNQLLGLAHYLFHRSTTQIELTCYLQDLFTLPSVRGQGIGRALIEAVYEQAKIAKSPRVYWQTKSDNLVARKLYDKLGKLSEFIIYEKKL